MQTIIKKVLTRTITDLRKNTLEVLNDAKEAKSPLFIIQRSEIKSVILDFADYQKIAELLNDYNDILEAEEILDKDVFIPPTH